MKGIAAVLAFLTAVFPLVAQESAEAIVRSSRNRIQAATTSTRARMVITAKNGSTSERALDQYSKDGPRGSRSMVVLNRPASVAGTRFLTMETGSGNNDQWIFLPSMGKVRRLAASEGSGSFVGTDFSYDDISSQDREVTLDTHTLVREDTYNGKLCYVIESRPRDNSYQYSKMVQWIGKDDKVNYKVELYDKRGTQVKLLEVLELKDVQGRLSVMRSRMTTLAAGTNTVLSVEILKYDDPIPESVFTTAYLETGKT